MDDFTDIIDCIQDKVNEIAKRRWDECFGNDLDFWVSRCFHGKEKESEMIILTINHQGWKYSRVLYPAVESPYGLYPLEEIMESLHNQSM